jgi:DNA-binding transcriptional MerR regulator
MKEQILALRAKGLSYNEIVKVLGCNKSTVAYHCNTTTKQKTLLNTQKRRKNRPLQEKIYKFKTRELRNKVRDFQRERASGGKGYTYKRDFNFDMTTVLKKIGDSPICYLTGRKIDLLKPSSFHLDHIISVKEGGTNTIDNMGLTCKEANMSKHELSTENFINLCKEVLIHNGFTVTNDN